MEIIGSFFQGLRNVQLASSSSLVQRAVSPEMPGVYTDRRGNTIVGEILNSRTDPREAKIENGEATYLTGSELKKRLQR